MERRLPRQEHIPEDHDIMSIDLLKEQLVSLDHARYFYPRTGRGQVPHRATITRHATTGCRGCVLESIATPRGLATSREAIARFFQQLTEVVAQRRDSKMATHKC